MDIAEVNKLVTYIEENLRASTSSGLNFVDSRHYRERLLSKQNHVVFGRRGAGKTSLVSCIRNIDHHLDVYLNLEDYKDITFPNIVIYVLLEMFSQLKEKIKQKAVWYKFWNREAKKQRSEIVKLCKTLKTRVWTKLV